MKKIIILLAFTFSCMISSFAQEADEKPKYKIKTEKIASTTLPQAVKKTLKEKYASYKIEKSRRTVGDLPQFYIELKKGNKKTEVVINYEGKIVK